MATENAPPTNDPSTLPPADPDEAKYAQLREELGMDESGEGVDPPDPPAPEPEPSKREGDPEPPPEPPAKPQHVPYTEHENVQKALREAREAAKASDERFAQVMRLIEQSRQQQAPPKQEEPAPLTKPAVAMEADPMAWLEYLARKNDHLETQLQAAHKGTQETGQSLQAYQQQQALDAMVVQSEADIRNPQSQNHRPDYDDAIQHIRTTRAAELNLMYPDDAPAAQQMAAAQGFRSVAEMKDAIFQHDADAVTHQAAQLGIPPAVYYYNLAVGRGYTPKTAQPQPDKGKQQIDALKRGRNAAISLSGGEGSRKGPNDMSLSDLADLFIEDADMADKVWDQMARAGRL